MSFLDKSNRVSNVFYAGTIMSVIGFGSDLEFRCRYRSRPHPTASVVCRFMGSHFHGLFKLL